MLDPYQPYTKNESSWSQPSVKTELFPTVYKMPVVKDGGGFSLEYYVCILGSSVQTVCWILTKNRQWAMK